MNKSEEWEVDQIKKVCKSLKNSKARDECGLIYELFKPPYAGPDVYESLCKLFNKAKQELEIPDFFELMSITSLYKNKGLRRDISNERGIFNVSIYFWQGDLFWCISDYWPEYELFECRWQKNRNIRDHLFVVNATINDVINGNGPSFDIHCYELQICLNWRRLSYRGLFSDLLSAQCKWTPLEKMICKLDMES